jgi:uncharacterized protein YndB with AHSA1/START domain
MVKKLNFTIRIQAKPSKVWQVLWYDTTYRQWTSVFYEGSYAVSDWKKGSKVQFLSPKGDGMFSVITELKPNEYIAFKHQGEIKNFVEQTATDQTKSWMGTMETYSLMEDGGETILVCEMDTTTELNQYFQDTFPKALAKIKEIAEHPVKLNIEACVKASIEKVWNFWTKPEHIMQWNNASDDWHTTRSENDLQVGGKFLSRMEAKDGSFGFDFEGIYTKIEFHKTISYTLMDGRKVYIQFMQLDDTCKIVSQFEAEEENSLELQQSGWLAILNNFKKYTEAN